MSRSALPLSRTLAIRMTLASVGVSLALMVFYAAHYLLDRQHLRSLMLEAQVQDIIGAMKAGEDPAGWSLYKDYPRSYGFRVFDHRQAWQRKVIAQANAGLLPPLDVPSTSSAGDLVTGFGALPGTDGQSDGDQWLMTGRGEVGGRVYWVQAVVVADPAWQWIGVLRREMLDHVVVPVLFIVPALTLAVYLTTRRVLQPLTRVARQASKLGAAVMSGQSFAPLSSERLPLEFRAVVAAINAMLAKLDRSLTLQKEFTSDVAHELRTPLAVLLLEVSQLPPGAATEHFRRELQGLGDLVNQLLRFAQAEDAMARQRHAVDLGDAARKVCEDLAGTAFGQQKSIEFDAPDEGVLVSGHPALIDAAIRNIVDNAVKLSPPRATISVTVDALRNIVVDDRGPGIADEHKKLIFERFWRADRQPKGGAGIGLALVRRIALLHGGDVRVEDRPGGGARFVLSFGAAAPV